MAHKILTTHVGDCGFSTFAGFGAVDSEIVWAKLQALSEGAEIASRLN